MATLTMQQTLEYLSLRGLRFGRGYIHAECSRYQVDKTTGLKSALVEDKTSGTGKKYEIDQDALDVWIGKPGRGSRSPGTI